MRASFLLRARTRAIEWIAINREPLISFDRQPATLTAPKSMDAGKLDGSQFPKVIRPPRGERSHPTPVIRYSVSVRVIHLYPLYVYDVFPWARYLDGNNATRIPNRQDSRRGYHMIIIGYKRMNGYEMIVVEAALRNYQMKHMILQQKYADIAVWLSKLHPWCNRNLIITVSPSCSSDFNDLAPAPTPPERRQGPVGTTRASRPAFLGEQKDLQQMM